MYYCTNNTVGHLFVKMEYYTGFLRKMKHFFCCPPSYQHSASQQIPTSQGKEDSGENEAVNWKWE